jgi:predicted transposase YdaD
MPGKPFDASVKDLIEESPLSWAQCFSRHPVRKATLVDADVSTLTAAADKVLRVEGDQGPCLLNIEAEARPAGDAPDRLLLYSTILRHRHDLPVRSVLLLLRREANASNLTGVVEVRDPDEEAPYQVFRYRVVRLWQEPMEPLLRGGLGTLPLAALTDEAAGNLLGVLRRIDERLRAEAPGEFADKMRTATFTLLGLRYEAALAEQLFGELANMEESTTYQAILSRGRLQEAREILLLQGSEKFGAPDAGVIATVESITTVERFHALSKRLLHVNSWQDLLGGA